MNKTSEKLVLSWFLTDTWEKKAINIGNVMSVQEKFICKLAIKVVETFLTVDFDKLPGNNYDDLYFLIKASLK
jgi:hypothetical protein